MIYKFKEDLTGARFWTVVDELRQQLRQEPTSQLEEQLRQIGHELVGKNSRNAASRIGYLRKLAETYGLRVEGFPEPPGASSSPTPGMSMDDLVKSAGSGVSLVTCCKNRNSNLVKALSSWLALPDISEIIIVDWDSDTPVADDLRAAGIEDPRIRIIRADNEPKWILTYAFNLGFRAATCNRILKVDADIVLSEDFFKRNHLRQGSFVTGDWRIAEEGQEFINGFFYVRHSDLFQVGGFNEYITTYGWDDDDIYSRLESLQLSRDRVDPKTIWHLPHDDVARLGKEGENFDNGWDELFHDTRFTIRVNRFIANSMPVWNHSRAMVPYRIEEITDEQFRVSRMGEVVHFVPDHVRRDAEYYGARDILSWQLGEVAFRLDRAAMDDLLGQYRLDEINRDLIFDAVNGVLAAPADEPKRLYIDAQHGLGNRLRAIASAAVVAEADGRELVVIWQPDHHCECRLSDIIEYDGLVLEESFVDDAREQEKLVYNYMEIEEGAAKDAPITLDPERDVYVRSAYVLNSELTEWSKENAFLRSLKPSKSVLDLVEGVRQPNDIGVHVRMEAGKGLDHNTYDSRENWTEEGHEQLHYWRGKSHYSRFMKRIDELLEDESGSRLFLAADRPEIYEAFIDKYGDRIACLEREVYDRSARQIQYALADVILLSRCKRLLGSTWSSFSELALRLAPTYDVIEMSGKDF